MLSTLFLLSILYPAFAVPQLSPTPAGQSITLTRKPRVARSVDDWGAWAKTHREMLEAKYGDRTPIQRRSSGTNL